MNRRTAFATLLGQKNKTQTKPQTTTLTQSLNPYTGVWGIEQASHLLRRATFGPTYAQMKDAVTDGMDATVAQLIADLPMPSPPVYYLSTVGTVGTTWVNDINLTGELNAHWRRSFYAWTMKQLRDEGVSIREKMTLFWQNHFGVSQSATSDKRRDYQYNNLLRENALGDFKQLVKDVTVSPGMLKFLNGESNTKNAPNENYARELMELFTLGKGDLAGEGDYTTFTEVDVVEMAKALTGWRIETDDSTGVHTINPLFVSQRHDTSTKQLSHRFNNATIVDGGDQEYINLIDTIFTLRGQTVAEFICRKIYRWFVHYTIDASVEQNVIVPMANLMIANNFQIKPVIETLLKSEAFYDACVMGSMVKNPLDHIIGILKQFAIAIPTDVTSEYGVLKNIYTSQTVAQQLEYYNPPTVAGWKAYYQEPQFYRIWINSVTLKERDSFSGKMVNGRNIEGVYLEIDVLALLTTLDNPADPNSVVDECAIILLPKAVTQEQKDLLKAILVSNQGDDAYWIDLYYNYLGSPTQYETTIDSRFRTMIEAMLSMAEFQLM